MNSSNIRIPIILHAKAHVGDAVMEVDGYYYFEPICDKGLANPHTLRLIADELDRLNKEWDEQIQRDLGNGK